MLAERRAADASRGAAATRLRASPLPQRRAAVRGRRVDCAAVERKCIGARHPHDASKAAQAGARGGVDAFYRAEEREHGLAPQRRRTARDERLSVARARAGARGAYGGAARALGGLGRRARAAAAA